MPSRWLFAATLLALAAPPARGDTPSLELGYLGPQVTIEQVLIVLRDEPRPRTAHVVLSLSATHVARRELTATLRLPPGTRVTNFAYTGGADDRRVAVPTPAPRAGESYAALRAWHGGALVEAAGPDQLVLRVPIAADHRAEIERCLADEVARWEFSAAPGGGELQVNYPVTFRIAR